MSQIRDLHNEAMRFAQLALIARYQKDIERAEQLAREALTLETQAASLIPFEPASEPTRSILFRSAASLALQCRDFQAAQRLIDQGLAGQPPLQVRRELQELLAQIGSGSETQPTKNIPLMLKAGMRVYDRHRGRDRLIHDFQQLGRVVKIWFRDTQSGELELFTFPAAEAERRFEVVGATTSAFQAEGEVVRLLAESYRLAHAYLFNPVFATETSLIVLLPHQLMAVYDHLLKQPRLRFLLADDAGAGKTIMAGLYIREMLLRRLVGRVLIVPPAGLVGNWESELRNLFRLQFNILDGADARRANPFLDPRNNLAIVSVDTLWRDRMHKHLLEAPPYDLVIFDEAHKLSARRNSDGTLDASNRYRLAAEVAAQNRHLLLLTATPHMGKDEPYYFLWRLLEPELLAAEDSFRHLNPARKRQHLLRRMKEQMVGFDEEPLFPPRTSDTVLYPLSQGVGREQDLYDQITQYCQAHYNRARGRNQSAAQLAMGVLQRRLASSTWAILRSLERREGKLAADLVELETGQTTNDELRQRQDDLPTEDFRETKTGDEEEAIDDREESERFDDDLSGATEAQDLVELRQEIVEVRRLVALARRIYEEKNDSKFEKLREALLEYPETKVLIFTEHRDTADFLVRELEGLGLTGKIARIDGTLDYKQRAIQADFFRRVDGARYLVATDAAGEGINLQFCWVLINYDVPWNPARLEQRMGRVHRYKQTHEVRLINLVADGTREGRVLQVLLEKLESIRKELGDKVFDVIGRQFHGRSLAELMFEAVVEGNVGPAIREIEQSVSKDQVQALFAEQARRVELSEVRTLLEGLKERQAQAEVRRMMPAYVRSFFQGAAPLSGVQVVGDVNGIFRLEDPSDSIRRATEQYPEEIQNKLTFDRALALPADSLAPRAIYLHPGEDVFDAVTRLFQNEYGAQADRGATFFDDTTPEPYLFYLVKVVVLREPERAGATPQILDEVMLGIRRGVDGSCTALPAHWLMTLITPDAGEQVKLPSSLVESADDLGPVETFVYEQEAEPRLEKLRNDAEARLPDRQKQLREAYNLREAELLEQRQALREAIAQNIPAAKSKLAECERELDALDARRNGALADLLSEIDRLGLGPVTVYVRALVMPIPIEQGQRRRDDRAEKTALHEVEAYELARGAVLEDVSNPQLAMGFDLRSTHPTGGERFIEVKGRARVGGVELTPNEWAQATNHRDKYWLYVVLNCETTPMLRTIADPVGKGIGRPKGGVTIDASDILGLAND